MQKRKSEMDPPYYVLINIVEMKKAKEDNNNNNNNMKENKKFKTEIDQHRMIIQYFKFNVINLIKKT